MSELDGAIYLIAFLFGLVGVLGVKNLKLQAQLQSNSSVTTKQK